ncbi:MAG TPA: hypothetical protein VGB77_03125 [Abditibacteriaceae bacterium]
MLEESTELARIYKLAKKAAVPVGPVDKKFLAVKGEIEIAKADGTTRSHFSDVTTLPKIKVWSLKKRDGSRAVYVQPSEKASQVQVWMARSASRDFQNAQWQKVLVTAPETVDAWQNFSVSTLASSKDKPYIAVYGEVRFGNGPQASRMLSEKIIWNGLPLPNAAQISDDVCPLHGTKSGVVPVLYGLRGRSANDPKDAVYAGCLVGPGSSTWHCRLCDCDWGNVLEQMAQRPD